MLSYMELSYMDPLKLWRLTHGWQWEEGASPAWRTGGIGIRAAHCCAAYRTITDADAILYLIFYCWSWWQMSHFVHNICCGNCADYTVQLCNKFDPLPTQQNNFNRCALEYVQFGIWTLTTDSDTIRSITRFVTVFSCWFTVTMKAK